MAQSSLLESIFSSKKTIKKKKSRRRKVSTRKSRAVMLEGLENRQLLAAAPFSADFTGFTGAGFAPSPAAGQLDSDDWRATGFGDNGVFGGTHTSGDQARGTDVDGGVSTGGVYAFDIGGNTILGVQPGGSDFTPGEFTLAIENTSGSTISDWDISYDLFYNNDQPRANSLNFQYSTTDPDSGYTTVPALDFTSPEASDALGFQSVARSVSALNAPVAAGGFLYVQWVGDDETGGGSRDEFGIDNVSIAEAGGGGGATLSIAATDAVKAEGDAGTTAFTFDITRSGDTSGTSDVTWTVTDVDTDAADFSGTLTATENFLAGETTKTVTIDVVGDTTAESDEDFQVVLSTPVGATIATGTAFGTIQDDDSPPPTSDLVITGVVDGPLTGGIPKAIEFYVINSIPDLSIYGVGSENAAAGGGVVEFTFPADPATAGDYIYVASESTEFTNFFGIAPDYTNGVAGINGDDSIELFQNGSVVDTFGDVNTDGTGEPWEYLDGWAYRNDGTGPDGSTFVLGNWMFSGINALDGETLNSSAATPFPIGTYSVSGGTAEVSIAADDASKVEGDAGLTDYTFTVTRTGPLTGALTVDYDVIAPGGAGVADLATDFSGVASDTSGQVTFADGVGGSQTVTVRVTGDTTAEDSETFTVDLSNPTLGVIGTGSAAGLIQDDDTALSSAVINEWVFNHTGPDVDEYIEIFGAPSEDLSAYSVLVIDSSLADTGTIQNAFTLGTADASGYQLAGGGVQTGGTFTNGDLSILLVRNFTGAVNDDLDTNDDGTFDSTPWTDIIDDVALGDGFSANNYSTTVLTPATLNDGNTFTPGGASRIANGVDTDSAADWRRNDFDGDGLPSFGSIFTTDPFEATNTPLAANTSMEPTPALTITESGGSTDVSESGATDTFSIGLTTNPASSVTVTVTPDSQVDLGSGPGVAIMLTFTDRLPQDITVTADDDALVEAAIHTGLISISTTSGDLDYDGLAGSVTANIADNDTPAPANVLE